MRILNKKSSKKEEVKTAQAYNCKEVTLYECYVDCPDCGYATHIESKTYPPKSYVCPNKFCNKQFNIEWE